jgi:hypothetical protein
MSSPSSKGKTLAIAGGAGKEIIRFLADRDFSVIIVPNTPLVDPRVAAHADLQIFTAEGIVFTHRDFSVECEGKIRAHAAVIRCDTILSPFYPGDCPFNIAFTGSHAICMGKIIPMEIAAFFRDQGIAIIDVPQGYARCSVVIVDANSIITEDAGIHHAATRAGLDALLVRRGHVQLAGFPYGFIGGATGTFFDRIYCTGIIDSHPDRRAIESFIAGKGKTLTYCDSALMRDIGSILFV